jgi:hypothetical protein
MRRNDEQNIEVSSQFIQGSIKAYLEVTKAINILQIELTQRMGDLLLSQTGGEVLGAVNRVPTLPSTSTKGSKASRKMAVASSSHSRTQKGKVGRPRSGGSWWYDLTKEQQQAIIAKRVKSNEATRKKQAA